MTEKGLGRKISAVLLTMILAGELAVVLDVILVYNGTALSVPKFAALLSGLFLLLMFIPGFRMERKCLAAAVCTAVLAIPLAVGYICWYSVSQSVVYQVEDRGKHGLYGDKKVMLLVPHQDDDFNVLGGVIEEYIKYGSEVHVVFSTNGDYYGKAEIRAREACNALGYLGVPEDHIIYLGYGDQWSADGPHLYNAEPGKAMTSVFGSRETYGTSAVPAYREGNAYTIDNFLSDIESVILEYLPDVIYCVDYDYNIDHRALSHSFEKVMGKILKENDSYRPVVMKGYAYNTAWEAVNDFYADNLLATIDAFSEEYGEVPGIYRWEDRVRLPVHGEELSRSVISAGQNIALSMYKSQGANMYGVRVINSDKVFWLRRTDSLCVDADIQVSSGNAAFLNDFMLLECKDLLEGAPYDGAWIPETADNQKQIIVRLPEKQDVETVVLYDHPDEACNVLNARIDFDDGFSVETGPLHSGGAENVVPVNRSAVSSFAVTILETEGQAGLTEVEAYGPGEAWRPDYVKIMDESGNFVYDYWIEEDGEQLFSVYNPGGIKLEETVFCLNQHCSAQWQGGKILVNCPAGESCIVYVTDENGEILDTVVIRNPGELERSWKTFWIGMEKAVMELCETKRMHERVFVFRLVTKLSDRLSG